MACLYGYCMDAVWMLYGRCMGVVWVFVVFVISKRGFALV